MARRTEPRVLLQPARYIRIGPCSEIVTGIPAATMNKKIERGEWVRDREWVKGPDGRRYLDVRGFEQWVESARELQPGVDGT